MRIGVFADVHGNLAALQAVLSDGEQQGVERWICLGDIAFKGPQPQECADTIASIPGLVQVVGNTDQWLFQGFPPQFAPPPERRKQLDLFRQWALQRLSPTTLERLRALPLSHTMSLGNTTMLLVHASPRSTEDWLPATLSEAELEPLVVGHEAGVVLYGHIHSPYIRTVNGRVVVNTGSTGNPTDGDNRASYALISYDHGSHAYTLRRIPYSVEDTMAAVRAYDMPFAEQVAVALRNGNAF